MNRRILGLFIVMSALVFASCPNPTTPSPDQIINLTAIPGVTAPVTGATPVTSINETAQYTGIVSWSPGMSTFAASTEYTANLILTAKPGYTLTGVVADSFLVAGATVTHPAGSGTVSAVFPATGAPSFSLNMATIPAGSFQRDSSTDNISTINTAYSMSTCEITMEQFVEVTGLANPSISFTGVVNGPVQNTNWYHALVFCNKLSMAEGLTPAYTISGSTDPADWGTVPINSSAIWNAASCNWSATGYRLPTEMEWMWAAIGATSDRTNGYLGIGTNTTGYIKSYAGSIEASGFNVNIGSYAWYQINSSSTTHTVGGKTANELGLYDMSGNVWEWCWDWYAASYPTDTIESDTDAGRGAASGTERVRRGSSWSHTASNCSVTARYGTNPNSQGNGLGFRVVCP
jgi:formylglycine-generating enzyme